MAFDRKGSSKKVQGSEVLAMKTISLQSLQYVL